MADITNTDQDAGSTTLVANSDAPTVLRGVDTEPLGDGEPPSAPKSPSPIIQIYRRLNSMFGDKAGQLFTLEYPGRILDIGNYSYKQSTGLEAQVTKPQAVAEAEFRISDDLFTIGQITGGPKGSKLSQVYNEILSSLVPSNHDESTFDQMVVPDQALVTKWLLEPVPNWSAPDNDPLMEVPESWAGFLPKRKEEVKKIDFPPEKMIPRVDLFHKLLTAYEDARLQWQLLKLNARPNKPADDPAWDLYDRMIATLSPSVDAKLEALWSVLLARGQYHRIRHYLGLLDVESPAEALLRAKEALRASKLRSVDDTEDVYPVQFSPASWGNYLTTDFEPVDLLMDPDALTDYVLSAQRQRNELIRQLTLIQSGKQDAKTLETELSHAEENLRKAQDSMLEGFTQNMSSLVSFFLARMDGPFSIANLKKFVTEKGHGLVITDKELQQVQDRLSNVNKCSTKYDEALNNYARILGDRAAAEASDHDIAISQLKTQIDALSQSIELYSSILEAPRKSGQGSDTGSLPLPAPKTEASQWQSLVIKYDHSNRDDKAQDLQSAETVKTVTRGWFWSAHYDQENAQASSFKEVDQTNTSVEIGMNIMKVQINRPWMDASIFDQSSTFVRISGTKFSNGFDTTLLSSEREKKPTGEELVEAFRTAGNNATLPTYPVAFIIAKDVTIKLTVQESSSKSLKEFMNKSMSTGGAILGFSCGGTTRSSASSQSAYSMQDGNTILIKIPGPQVIGWIMQCTPEDQCSTDYQRVNEDQFKLSSDTKGETDAGKK